MAGAASVLIPALSALVGALIGAWSSQRSARGTRESDRRKRCVDRVLSALTSLDKAYFDYVTATFEQPEAPYVVLPVHGALRNFTQAVQSIDNPILRNHADRYRENLTAFYLVFGQLRDPLDDPVPTLGELNAEHTELAAKLRRYESK